MGDYFLGGRGTGKLRGGQDSNNGHFSEQRTDSLIPHEPHMTESRTGLEKKKNLSQKAKE